MMGSVWTDTAWPLMQPAATSKQDLVAITRAAGACWAKGVGDLRRTNSEVSELISRRKGQRDEVVAQFDWDDFDSDVLRCPGQEPLGTPPATLLLTHGTILRTSTCAVE
jgi:hypothetical protein